MAVKSFRSREFRRRLESLPQSVQTLARANWSARVGIHYRAVGQFVANGFLWNWIGTHAEYDRLVGKG